MELDRCLWEERWQADVRSARALAALSAKDAEIDQLKEEMAKVREKLFNQSLCRENRIEDRLETAADKISNLESQLQSTRRAKEAAINDKLDLQTNCRATQERLAYAESRVSELITENTVLAQKLKDAKTARVRSGPRLCQKNELETAQKDLIRAQQRAEESNNKLSGVKAQRETLSNQLRDQRQSLENEKQKRFETARQIDTLQNKDGHNIRTISDLQQQLGEQQTLVQQLQQLHSDAQNLLHVQEEQHKEQLYNYKKSQQKLIVFCQKVENKRKEEKKIDNQLKSEIKKLNTTVNEKSGKIEKLEGDRTRQEEETIALRFQIQQMLDEAQMCDTKNTVVSKEHEAAALKRDKDIEIFIKTNQENMKIATEKRFELQNEVESQILKNSELMAAYDKIQEKHQNLKTRLAQRNDQIKDFKNKINSLEIHHRHVSKKLDEENAKVDEIQNELTVMTKSRDRAASSIKLLKNDKKLLEVEIDSLREKNETMKLQFVKAKYKKFGFDDEAEFENSPDKSANKAAALELKLLRQSVNKLGQDVTIQRARRDELEEMRDNLREDLNTNKEENELLRERLNTAREDARKSKHTVNIQQQRIAAMSDKISSLGHTSENLKQLENLPQRLKSVESRLKISNTENIQLKARMDEMQRSTDKEEKQDLHVHEKSEKLSKDNHQKRFLIEELRNKVRTREKDLAEKDQTILKLKDDLEFKTSTMQQRKRSHENLRRQLNELKLEKDALNAELGTIRSRLEKSEKQGAELRLELQSLETITGEQMKGFELDRDDLRNKQQQAMSMLSDRLADTDQSRRELSQTLKDVALALSRRIQKQRLVHQQKCAQSAIGQSEPISGDCTEKVCDILKISKDEFSQIMNIDESDLGTSDDWVSSVDGVIDAGPPFTETIVNSFRHQLDELCRYIS